MCVFVTNFNAKMSLAKGSRHYPNRKSTVHVNTNTRHRAAYAKSHHLYYVPPAGLRILSLQNTHTTCLLGCRPPSVHHQVGPPMLLVTSMSVSSSELREARDGRGRIRLQSPGPKAACARSFTVPPTRITNIGCTLPIVVLVGCTVLGTYE